jgi:hypothetical protein
VGKPEVLKGEKVGSFRVIWTPKSRALAEDRLWRNGETPRRPRWSAGSPMKSAGFVSSPGTHFTKSAKIHQPGTRINTSFPDKRSEKMQNAVDQNASFDFSPAPPKKRGSQKQPRADQTAAQIADRKFEKNRKNC